MSDRNNIQLAIGYGLGSGMFLAGLFVVLGHLALSFFNIPWSVYILGALLALAGVTIAVINALKMDRTAVGEIESRPE